MSSGYPRIMSTSLSIKQDVKRKSTNGQPLAAMSYSIKLVKMVNTTSCARTYGNASY